MLPDRAVGEQLVPFCENLAEWRKIKGIENFEPSRELPGEEEQNNADHTEPIGEQLASTLPPAIRRQRLGLIDGNQIDRVLLLFRRKQLL